MEWIALWQTFNGAFEVTLLIFRFGTSPTNQKNPTNLEHSWVTRLWQLHRAWPLCTGCRGQLCPGLQVSQNGWALKASCDPIQNMGLYQLHSASGPQWWNPDRSDYSCAVINTCFRCQLLQMPFYRKKQDFFPLFIFLQVPWPGNLTFSGSHLCTFQLFLNPISDMYWQQNGSENRVCAHPEEIRTSQPCENAQPQLFLLYYLHSFFPASIQSDCFSTQHFLYAAQLHDCSLSTAN